MLRAMVSGTRGQQSGSPYCGIEPRFGAVSCPDAHATENRWCCRPATGCGFRSESGSRSLRRTQVCMDRGRQNAGNGTIGTVMSVVSRCNGRAESRRSAPDFKHILEGDISPGSSALDCRVAGPGHPRPATRQLAALLPQLISCDARVSIPVHRTVILLVRCMAKSCQLRHSLPHHPLRADQPSL
jgi:hypothetical protein